MEYPPGGLFLGSSLSARLSTAGTAGAANTSPGVPVTAVGPATVSTAAFGSGYSAAPMSRAQALHPLRPVGLAFWTGVLALGLLVFIWHELPA